MKWEEEKTSQVLYFRGAAGVFSSKQKRQVMKVGEVQLWPSGGEERSLPPPPGSAHLQQLITADHSAFSQKYTSFHDVLIFHLTQIHKFRAQKKKKKKSPERRRTFSVQF